MEEKGVCVWDDRFMVSKSTLKSPGGGAMLRDTREGRDRAGIVGRVIPDIEVAVGSNKSLMSTTWMTANIKRGRGLIRMRRRKRRWKGVRVEYEEEKRKRRRRGRGEIRIIISAGRLKRMKERARKWRIAEQRKKREMTIERNEQN